MYVWEGICMGVWTYECKCQMRPKTSDLPVAGLPGSCKLPNKDARTKLGSFARAICSFSFWVLTIVHILIEHLSGNNNNKMFAEPLSTVISYITSCYKHESGHHRWIPLISCFRDLLIHPVLQPSKRHISINPAVLFTALSMLISTDSKHRLLKNLKHSLFILEKHLWSVSHPTWNGAL